MVNAHSLQGPLYHQGWAQLCASHGMRRLCAVVVQSHLLPLWANSGEGGWRSMSEMSVLVTLDMSQDAVASWESWDGLPGRVNANECKLRKGICPKELSKVVTQEPEMRVGYSEPRLVERGEKEDKQVKKGGSFLTCCLGGGLQYLQHPPLSFSTLPLSEPRSRSWDLEPRLREQSNSLIYSTMGGSSLSGWLPRRKSIQSTQVTFNRETFRWRGGVWGLDMEG